MAGIHAVCELVGVQTQAWLRYEKGQPFNLELLVGLEKAGIDMMYVIFGVKKRNSELSSENQLVKLYETVEPEQREGLIYLAKAFAAAYPVK